MQERFRLNHPSRLEGIMKHSALFLLMTAFLPASMPAAYSQTANILSSKVIVADPPNSIHFEKSIGNFTSTTYPSYFLGTNESGYIFDTTTGQNCSVGVSGQYYERSRTYTYPGDKYAGVIASLEYSTVWLENPLNVGKSLCGGWNPQVVNPSLGAHDMRLADFDGDGKMDVLASGQNIPDDRTTGFISFQNNYNAWVQGSFQPTSGDGIGVLAINGVNGGADTNIVACNPSNNELYWYQNPGGSAARTANWTAHLIATTSINGSPACTAGVSLSTLNVGNRYIVVIATNEGGTNDTEVWTPGLGYYDPGSNPNGLWTYHEIDDTFRDVHEVATDVLNGVPFFVAGEQEQTSLQCNGEGYNTHGSLYNGCRVAIFPWNGNGFNAPTIASELGAHNETLFQLNGVEYLAGANHDEYEATDPAYHVWTFNFGGGGGGSSQLTAGNYNIGNGTYVIDGGFFSAYWGFPPAAETYQENGSPVGSNSSQEFKFAASGTDFTICNVQEGACLTDGGSVVDIGQGTDTWLVAPSGSGYTLMNTRTGKYMGAVPSVSRGNIAMSSSPVVLTLTLESGGTTSFSAGTYNIGSSYVIDGGFYSPYWGDPPAAEVYAKNGSPVGTNPSQEFNFVASGSDFTICNVPDGACLTDGGSVVDIGQGTDTWLITASGSGWTLKNARTGMFMGAIPSVARGNVGMSATPVTVTLGAP
jgi:hypothetical protein